MSDNEDLLGDETSLADYNLGNEEEEQLLADDYEGGPSQNVPNPGHGFVGSEYPGNRPDYDNQVPVYSNAEECVVPNLAAEPPSTYAPYEPPPYNHHTETMNVVPPPIMAAPIESPQIVPSEINPPINNTPGQPSRAFPDRPPRMPRVRDIPDSLDAVVVPHGRSWRPPVRGPHPYRKHNVHRGNFLQQRPPFPPPQVVHHPHPPRPEPPKIRMEHQIRPPMPLEQIQLEPQLRPQPPPMMPEHHLRPKLDQPPMRPNIMPERMVTLQEPQLRPHFGHDNPNIRMNLRPQSQPFRPRYPPNSNFRPNMEEMSNFGPRPNFERPPFYQQRPPFNQRPFAPQIREMAPNALPQITIRQAVPQYPPNNMKPEGFPPKMGMNPDFRQMEQEVRMLPVLPPNLPPGGLPGKKVHINPHFKGIFQPPIEGPVKDIDDAAERFIAEQRNALARAANRKYQKRSPQRYIENTTIEIENELVREESRRDDDLLRRQEEFINANRAGLRRRMRSPSPVNRRSISPRRRVERSPNKYDEESEYRRKLREQENLRERVLRAKEVRRRKNAVQLQKQEVDREPLPRPREPIKPVEPTKPDTAVQERDVDMKTKESEREEKVSPALKEKSPDKEKVTPKEDSQNLTPPRESIPEKNNYTPVTNKVRVEKEIGKEKKTEKAEKQKEKSVSPERAMTPPLPIPEKVKRSDSKTEERKVDYDFDDLDLILNDFEGILSDEEDSGRFKEKTKPKVELPKQKTKPQVDLRSKLGQKPTTTTTTPEVKKVPLQRQKITFTEDKEHKKAKTPPKRPAVSASKDSVKEKDKVKPDPDMNPKRQRIIFDNRSLQAKPEEKQSQPQSNRRVVLQRKVTNKVDKSLNRHDKADLSKPNAGIFSRAIRNTITNDSRVKNEPQILFEDSDLDEDELLNDDDVGSFIAIVKNLPHGMTEMRLNTLAGSEVQSVQLDKEERSANLTFKSTSAAEGFRRKFNNKMVAASRLTVVLK